MIVSSLEWKQRVGFMGCVVHVGEMDGWCEGVLQSHHVLTQQALRKRGLEHLRWDVRNGVCVCEGAHRRHTLALERIPYEALPPAALEFADEVGLGWMIDRYYPRRNDEQVFR